MATMQCQICRKSIKGVTLDKGFEWLESHKCKPKKKSGASCPYCHAVDRGGAACWQCGKKLSKQKEV